MRISVIVPAYNASPWIAACLASVRAQERKDLETIVIDDGSTDDTARIVDRTFSEVRLIRSSNKGPSHARNLGTSLSTGEFIQYLDADDLLAQGKLTTQMRLLDSTNADVAYGSWAEGESTPEGGITLARVIDRQITSDCEIRLFTDFWCPPATYLFRRSIVQATGGWSPTLPIIQDARFVFDCAARGARFVYCPGNMATYRRHTTDSLSRRDPIGFVRDCFQNCTEVQAWWSSNGGITEARRDALLNVYGYVARASFEKDRSTFDAAHRALDCLKPGYFPERPRHMALASRLLGYRRAESLALEYRKARQLLRPS